MDLVLEKGAGLQRTWDEMKIQSEKFAQQREHPGFGETSDSNLLTDFRDRFRDCGQVQSQNYDLSLFGTPGKLLSPEAHG